MVRDGHIIQNIGPKFHQKISRATDQGLNDGLTPCQQPPVAVGQMPNSFAKDPWRAAHFLSKNVGILAGHLGYVFAASRKSATRCASRASCLVH